MGVKIGEGSKYEINVELIGVGVFVYQSNRWVRIHIDDIPELIKELERISKNEEE